MTTADPSATFEPHRRRLMGLAYRMLGSLAEAEDVVQDAYLRWHATNRAAIAEPRAFLMTTTTRLCLDVLKSARVTREEYVGPWLPEPVTDTASLAPDTQTELAEDLSVALLLALERLSPLERAAFLLHDVFDYSFSEVGAALDRDAAACRQLAARARAHVRESRPRGVVPHRELDDARHTQLVSAFMAASRSGDIDGLKRLLATDARIVADGGGKATSALNVIHGAQRVAAFMAGVVRKGWSDAFEVRHAHINGLPGLLLVGPDGPVQTTAFEFDGDVVTAIYVVRNPDKLVRLARTQTSAQ